MNLNEKTLVENYVYKGKILKLKNDKVILPNGNTSFREIVVHGGGSSIYCEKDNKVLMVKQFRYAYNKELLEIPAGKLNEGEDPLQTAKRELEEECGVIANKLTKVFEVYPSPGYTNEVISIFKAEDIVEGKQNLDDDEFLTCCWIEKDKLKQMIEKGEIKDSKTLIALLHFIK